jgi:hypothetical protein
MAAFIVNGENAIVYFEHSDIQVEGGHCNTSTLKQIGLSRYVNPVAHDQMVSKKGKLQTQAVNFSFRPWTKMSFLCAIFTIQNFIPFFMKSGLSSGCQGQLLRSNTY